MKKLFLMMIVSGISWTLSAQCVPDESCIDTEAPGQICPDTLPGGYVNGQYEQVITIIPPDSFMLSGNPIYLSHIQLYSIANVPPGLSWESNASSNIFAVGNKYCAVISGLPSTEGVYNLGIGIYPYVNGFPMGILVVDDTSLSITIGAEQISTPEFESGKAFFSCSPNPARDEISFEFMQPEPAGMQIEVFDAGGQRVRMLDVSGVSGRNRVKMDLAGLPAGLYYYRLGNGGSVHRGKFSKM